MADVEFSPAELDRLEDALEGLEDPASFDRWLEQEPSPNIRERMTDYQTVLAASREAMPLENVPEGVLDGVLAEARQAAAAPSPPRPRGWARLRRSLFVPAVALAATAALVLWIERRPSQPHADTQAVVSASQDAADAVQRSKVDEEAVPEPLQPPSPAEAPATAAPSADAAAAEGSVTAKPIQQETREASPSLDQPKAIGNAKSKDNRAPTDLIPEGQELIRRGDQARLSDDCVTAREDYAVALEDDDPRVRARAFAGMGLCDRLSGNDPAADANLERARQLDGSIDGFVESQQQKPRSSSRPRRTKRKSKASPARPTSKMDAAIDSL